MSDELASRPSEDSTGDDRHLSLHDQLLAEYDADLKSFLVTFRGFRDSRFSSANHLDQRHLDESDRYLQDLHARSLILNEHLRAFDSDFRSESPLISRTSDNSLPPTTPKFHVDLYNARVYRSSAYADLSGHSSALLNLIGSISAGGEARLLQVEPGECTEPVRCKFVIPLLDKPYARRKDQGIEVNNEKPLPSYARAAYTAVSYAWNHEDTFASIFVGGDPASEIPFLVRKGVETLLRRLRSSVAPLVVWIDCICIDQQNIFEREAQVARMWDVYRNAANVVVWLGDNLDLPVGGRITAERMAHLLAQGGPRSWWRRLWVVQESAAARQLRVMVGSKSILWNDAIQLARTAMKSPVLDASPTARLAAQASLTALLSINTMRVNASQRTTDSQIHSLRYLFLWTVGSHCSNPLDRVYALLGIFSSVHTDNEGIKGGKNGTMDSVIKPDYSKPADLLFIEIVLFILRQDRALDILVDAWPRSENLGLSWVPDFSNNSPACCAISDGDLYESGSRLPPRWSLSSSTTPDNEDRSPSDLLNVSKLWFSTKRRMSPLCLHIQAIQLDKVQAVCRPFHELGYQPIPQNKGSIQAQIVSELVSMLSVAQDLSFDADDPRQHLEQISFDHDGRHSEPISEALHLRCIFESWQRALLNSKDDEDARSTMRQAARYLKPYSSALSKTMEGRTFFCTEHGLVGIGSRRSRAGDSVVVALGASVPFILRSHKRQGYTLVGDAFVQGVMAGELLRLQDRFPDQLATTDYALR